MKKNTVPEVRPDINGKLVTRHVKVNQSGSISSRVPAPPTPPTTARDYYSNVNALKNAMQEAVDTGAYDDVEDVRPNFIFRHLEQLQPHIVEAYREQIEATPDIGYEDLLISVLANKMHSNKAGYVLFITQQAIPEYGLSNNWDDDAKGTYEFDESLKVLKGIENFYKENRHNLPSDIWEADIQTREEIKAITELIKLGNRQGIPGIEEDWSTGSFFIDDVPLGEIARNYVNDVPRIVDLIDEHSINANQVSTLFRLEKDYPDNVERIAAIMVERDTSDAETIREVLGSEVKTLSNGIL